ncbi:DUF4199 domain-containing protein [Marivirga atlantica]|jgi:hypothetical protein|uniref:DUF4199 domain-containing protein n=1 Tax=Marivirga atlantica TaxID=1548457 RepID=A0A937A7L3_9BACT|nr:DUF4199 domain-containing protein [Marivirga atlantica]MBL0763665.1 DUF4199 domain-containing protein [Marivirga atlantica]
MENQEVQNNSAHPIKWGVIMGVASVIISLLIYVIDVTLFVKPWVGFLSLAVGAAIIVYSGFDYRKQLGGFMSYGKAFMHAFVVLLVGGFIGAIFRYLLFNVIDPEASQVLVDATIEMTMGMMEAIGASGDTAAMDRAAEQARNSYTLSGIAMGYLWGIIWYAIIAAIVGLITKKKNKELDF